MTEGDRVVREGWIDHLERQILVDIFVQQKFPVFDCPHQCHARDGLADRTDVHDRVRLERERPLFVSKSVSSCPDEFFVDDNGRSEPHDVGALHPLLDGVVDCGFEVGGRRRNSDPG